jgi:hypothetical protein
MVWAGGTTQIVTPETGPQGGVGVGVVVLVDVAVLVGVGVFVAVHEMPPTRHGVCVGVGVRVGVAVFVGVGVQGSPPTRHGVCVGVGVRVAVGVSVCVGVGVGPMLIAPPATLSIGIEFAPGVSNVTWLTANGVTPSESALKRRRSRMPYPSGPGGDGPSVRHVIATRPGVALSMVGQFTARPVLPRKRLWASASNDA